MKRKKSQNSNSTTRYKFNTSGTHSIYIDFHPVILAAKTSTLTTSGAPVSSSSTDENKAAATLPARWASLPASLAKKSIIPKVLVPGK